MDFIASYEKPIKMVPWSIDQLLLSPNLVGVGNMNLLCSFHNFQADGDLTQNWIIVTEMEEGTESATQ